MEYIFWLQPVYYCIQNSKVLAIVYNFSYGTLLVVCTIVFHYHTIDFLHKSKNIKLSLDIANRITHIFLLIIIICLLKHYWKLKVSASSTSSYFCQFHLLLKTTNNNHYHLQVMKLISPATKEIGNITDFLLKPITFLLYHLSRLAAKDISKIWFHMALSVWVLSSSIRSRYAVDCYLTNNEELVVVQWARVLGNTGFGISPEELIDCTNQYRPRCNNFLCTSWFHQTTIIIRKKLVTNTGSDGWSEK